MREKLVVVFTISVLIASLAVVGKPAMADTKSDVQALMENVRKHEVVDNTTVLDDPPLEVLAELPRYMDDPDHSVRTGALTLALGVARRNPGLDIQQKVVQFLLNVAESGDTSGLSRLASERLVSFSRAAFTDESKKAVERLMARPEPWPEVVLLAGVINLQAAKPQLEKWSQGEDNKIGWFGRRTWAAHLALARMGVETEIDYCIKRVESEKDSVMRATRLLRDLAYIRQPQTVAVLVNYLIDIIGNRLR